MMVTLTARGRHRVAAQRKAATAKAWQKLQAAREEAMKPALVKFFESCRRDVVGSASLSVNPEKMKPPKKWATRIRDMAEPHLTACLAAGATFAAESVDAKGFRATLKVETPLWDAMKARGTAIEIQAGEIEFAPNVLQAIKDELQTMLDRDYWDAVNQTTIAKAARAIQKSIERHESQGELVARLNRALGKEAANYRVEAMARTEVTSSLNAGCHAEYDELYADGIISGRTWLAAGGARPDHAAASGQTVAMPDEWFDVGDETCPYPGWYGLSAANRISCRCTTMAEIA